MGLKVTMSAAYAGVTEDDMEIDLKMKSDVYKKSGGRCGAAGVCLGLVCFILLTAILALVAHNHGVMSSWCQHQMRPAENENLTSIVMDLQARFNNLTETKNETRKKNGPCPLRWIEVNRECFYICPKGVSKTWLNSKKDCANRGGRLVTIKTRVRLQVLGLFHNHAWIGLSDKETEGLWEWEDGTHLESNFWMKNEPNNHNNEDCAHLSVEGEVVGFNDNRCDVAFPYICEASG